MSSYAALNVVLIFRGAQLEVLLLVNILQQIVLLRCNYPDEVLDLIQLRHLAQELLLDAEVYLGGVFLLRVDIVHNYLAVGTDTPHDFQLDQVLQQGG